MNKYTEDQLYKAIVMAQTFGPAPVECSTSDLRRMLDHLPDQPDEWEECNYEDIKGTDQKVRAVYGDGVIIEGPVQEIYVSTVVLVGEHRLPRLQAAKYYRIPAPVVHPDPAEHPVIVNVAVDKPGTNVTHRYDYATWDAQDHYECWNNDGSYYGAWEPSTIREWTPGKVIADE